MNMGRIFPEPQAPATSLQPHDAAAALPLVYMADFHRMAGAPLHHPIWVSNQGIRLLKLNHNNNAAALQREWRSLHVFERLASHYAPARPRLVQTDAGDIAIETGSAGPAVFDIFHTMSYLEFALCQLQTIEMLLLIGNTLELHEVHNCNVCYRGSDPDIRIVFIDTQDWSVHLHRPTEPCSDSIDEVVNQNI